MHIQLNGDSIEVPEPLTVAQLLVRLELSERRVAVEINHEIVPRSRHALHALAEGDRVELVHALGGG